MSRSRNALRVVALSTISALILIGIALLRKAAGPGPARLTYSVLQAGVGLAWVVLLARWSWTSRDELERRIMTEAGALAFLVAAGLSLIVGFLSDAAVPTPDWEYVYAMLTVLWVLAYGVISARYR